MIAQVVPALRLPRSMRWFDYRVPTALLRTVTEGQIVAVPFRRRSILGVIWRLRETAEVGAEKLRPLDRVVEQQPFLDQAQRAFFDWIAMRYAVSPGLLLKSLVTPQFVAAQKQARKTTAKTTRTPRLPAPLLEFAGGQLTVVLVDREGARETFLADLIASGARVGVVVPQLDRLSRLADTAPATTVVIREQTPGERAAMLRRYDTAQLFLGTRSLLLTPLPRLDAIVIDDEDDDQHKQRDQQPRVSSLTLAERLATAWQVPLIALSVAPSLAAYGRTRTRTQPFRRLATAPRPSVQLFTPQQRSTRRRGLPPEVRTELADALSRHDRTFLFLNRRGIARLVTCADCHWIATCSRCGITATRHEDALSCHHCGSREPLPSICPTCNSHRLDALFPGTAGFAAYLSAAFPGQVRRVDRDLGRGAAPQEPILIGTEYAFPLLRAYRPDRIIVLGFDQLFVLPSARATERGFQLLSHLAALDSVRRISIETRFPKHVVFQAFAKQESERFYAAEWQVRSHHHLPPATPTLMFESRQDTPTVRTSLLNWLLTHGVPKTAIRGPIHVRRRQRAITRYLINEPPASLAESYALTDIPESWIIDPEPLE